MENQTQVAPVDLEGVNQLKTAPEVVDPTITIKVDKLTPAGRAMVTKHIHPPGNVTGYRGMTTQDARIAQTVEYRNSTLNPQPLSVQSGTFQPDTTTDTWGYIVSTGARIHAIGVSDNNGVGAIQQNAGDVIYNDSYNFNSWGNDVNNSRLAYKSLTLSCNNTAFTDTGLITVAQMRPTIYKGQTIDLFDKLGADGAKSFINAHRDAFIDSFTHRVDEDELVIIPKWTTHQLKRRSCFQNRDACVKWFDTVTTKTKEQFAEALAKLKMDPNALSQILILGGCTTQFPSISQLQQMSVRSYTGKFKDGAFTVLRHNSTDPQFAGTSTNAPVPLPTGTTTGLFYCYTFYRDSAGAPHTIQLVEQVAAGTPVSGTVPMSDTEWHDMTWSFVLATGVSYNLVVGPGETQSSANMIRKIYAGFELQPTPQSAYSSTASIAPEPDFEAMLEMMRLFYSMKDGMPASYNFLGKVLGTIGRGAARIGKKALAKTKKATSKAMDAVTEEMFENTSKEKLVEDALAETQKLSKQIARLKIENQRLRTQTGNRPRLNQNIRKRFKPRQPGTTPKAKPKRR